MVENVAGVMPKPNNLDQAEDDAHIPLHQSGPDGKMLPEDDDQDPDAYLVQEGKYIEKVRTEAKPKALKTINTMQ